MDHKNNTSLFPNNHELTKNNNFGDTTLSLDCFSHGKSNDADDGCGLVLGLGPTPSIYSSNYYPREGNKSKEPATILHQPLSPEGDSVLKLGLSGGNEELSGMLGYSFSAPSNPSDLNQLLIPALDEVSTSAKKFGGYMPSLLLAPRMDRSKIMDRGTKSCSLLSQLSSEPSTFSDYSVGNSSELATNPRKCKFVGCTKRARGTTGLCIGHGGGQRCQKPGCNKGSESRTAYCKAHGGGRRCQHLGCTKSADGRTDYCIAHGGGRRCTYVVGGCTKAARGKSGLCIRHGGGKRCRVEGCNRSAEGQVRLCISHGGGRRCQFPSCNKGAQGSTMYCKAHGGGKRCVFAGCTRGAEGRTLLCKRHGGGKRCSFSGGGICPRSVHGGTEFCVSHGGGKRCAVPSCTKSARGRTDCCVRHGGGKRCKYENCGKSAQGSTDFCKAHGGGKRCNWVGERECEKFARGKSGLCMSHSSMVQDHDSNKKCMIGPRLFHGLVPAAEKTYSSSGPSAVLYSVDPTEETAKRGLLIPNEVLVPFAMKASSSHTRMLSSEKKDERSGGERKSFDFTLPEGRVHGGGLMSLLGGNLHNAIDGI
ncbi:hypothetical protein LguiA_027155 [Lonicera macranthoides]